MDSTAIQQALVQQVSQYISQYTPNPRIISYLPNEKGDVMGRFESQGRVFSFRLSGKGLVYKPVIPRKDGESDSSYALRFDTGSEILLEQLNFKHRTATQSLDRTDAAKAYKPRPSITIGGSAKKQSGDRKNPNCSAISYRCGVCISLGKNCIKNANTAVLKERLNKINSLARMAAKGQAVPQVKTGVIGAKTDPKSLMKKAQKQARELAKGGKTGTNPKAKDTSIASNAKPESKEKSFTFNEKLSWGENRKALRNHLEKLGVSTGDEGVGPDSYWKDRVKKLEQAAGIAKKDPKAVSQSEFNEMIDALPVKHPIFAKMRDWQRNTLKDPVKVKELKAKYGENASLTEIYKNEVYSKESAPIQPDTKARQAALRAAAAPNKTTTLATPYPLTAQAQKRLERGESITDFDTYAISKKGDKYLVTDPQKFEDKGKILDKAGLADYMKALEAQPRAIKKSSAQNPVIPMSKDPDEMLRALRNGRLIGDKKQGYEIQQRGNDYLITTMPNKSGDYSGVMTRKELVALVKSGGDGSKFKASTPIDKNTKSRSQEEASASFSARYSEANKMGDQAQKEKYGYARGIYVPSEEAKASALQEKVKWEHIIEQGIPEDEKPALLSRLKKDKFGYDISRPELLSLATSLGFDVKGKRTDKIVEEIADKAIKNHLNKKTKEPSDYIPLTSDKNLSNYRKNQQRPTDKIAVDRAKNDVANATKAINKIDDSIKKLKAGSGVMSDANLKKLASLERSKAEWEGKRDQHRAKVEELTAPKEAPAVQGVGNTEAERRQFLLNTNTQETSKFVEPKREIELADVKTPQDHVKYATQELNIAKASKDPERINKWIEELQRAKKKLMASTQAANNTYQPDLFFVNKGNPNQRSLFDSAEYDDSVERNILSNIGLMISRAMAGNQTSPNTVQLRKVRYANNAVTGIFTQYGSQYDFEISSKGVVISPLKERQDRAERLDRNSGIAYKKTAKIGANRKCGRGYKCKGTCISKNNKCRVNWASKEGLEQYKSMVKELDSLATPRFIEINGRQVAQRNSPEDMEKLAAMSRRVSEARKVRQEFGADYKAKTAKTYKIINDRVNAEVERRLKDANLSPNKVKSTLAELDPKDIAVDPKRFQYKITGEHTATGTVGSLQGVGKWDENLAGILQVWKDPKDGKTYVVNGHNRLAKANELGADKVAVRYLEVPTHQEARTIGAMTNIAEGRGNALDAAKFFRDTNWTKEDLVKKGIPLKEKIATDGLAISALEPNLFRQVIDGELPLERAAIIGGSGLNHEKQKSLVELLEKRKNINNSVLSELIDTVKYAGQKQEEQFDLFGNSTATVDLAVQRASLQSFVKQKLASEKKLFGTVSKSKSAKDLERGGNQIDIDQSSKIADEAATALKIFDAIKHNVGGVSDALNSASEKLASAKNKSEQDKIKRETYEQVLKAVQQENDKLLKGTKRSDSGQRTDSNYFGQSAADQILTYVTDNSNNMMGIVQLGGIKYRFLKPVYGATVLTPISETSLGYLFDLAPDLSLVGCKDPLDKVMSGAFNGDSLKKKDHEDSFLAALHPRYPKGHPNAVDTPRTEVTGIPDSLRQLAQQTCINLTEVELSTGVNLGMPYPI